MISFYPGPSRIHKEIPGYVRDAASEGIMSINHRSDEFVAMSKRTIGLLKQKLSIPRDYTVLFTSSATECWEIIAQSLITDVSYHIYNGAFGQKWFEYTHKINPVAVGLPFDPEQAVDASRMQFSDAQAVICLTQNETSNGTSVSQPILRSIRKNNPDHLIAIDATSSMGGVMLDFKSADIWFASVQKCFGLPAGMGIMVCSPRAVAAARAIDERNHYNSLPFMLDMMDKWQTPFTPNVLCIYLLMRVLENSDSIREVHARTEKRAADWLGFLTKKTSLQYLIQNPAVRSSTVIALQGEPASIQKIKKEAKQHGFLLGEGYGAWKPTTFRIANFPTLLDSEINALRRFLQN
jgi:phosphoserine aminotransferase